MGMVKALGRRARIVLPLALWLGGVAMFLASPVKAEEPPWRHAISRIGTVKYPPGYKHFDYVNPDAPKGGLVRLSSVGTFDNFNTLIDSVKGQSPPFIGLLYQSLMSSALDEIATQYGNIAEAIRYPEDYGWVAFRLNPKARWHDGKPITPEDVIFSMAMLKRHSPYHSFYYRNVVHVEKTGEREVTFRFDQTGIRELPYNVGELTIYPKHWWEGTDANGKKRDTSETTLEKPLGSGLYRIKSFEPGRYITYERVRNEWLDSLPIYVGMHNFDELRVEFFRDETVELEAFKGDQVDFRFESLARQWARSYDFAARREGKVILEQFREEGVGSFRAFVLNLRREKFQDIRVRRAFNLAFDFEEANRTLFFNVYSRVNSYFYGLEIASKGLPEGAELALLEEYRGRIPDEVFTTVFENPRGGSQEALRANLREAARLLAEAGWVTRQGRLVNAKTGEPFRVEMLVESESFERVMLYYRASLIRLGMEVTIRKVDITQYDNRKRKRDFDLILENWVQFLIPGADQREYWGSAAADKEASSNWGGIKNPVVDELIERLVTAKDRQTELVIISALDRVLLHNHYAVPAWEFFFSRTARWDRFSRPPVMPRYGAAAFPSIWWYDKEKSAKLGATK